MSARPTPRGETSVSRIVTKAPATAAIGSAAVRVADTDTIAPEKAAERVCRAIFDGLGDRATPGKKLK